MGKDTNIQWAGHSASPWYGCSEKHLGCDNCYARELSKRNPSTLGVWGDGGTRVKSKSFIKNLRSWNRRAEKAGKIESVFPSLCDPFEDRPELVEWRREMFAVADECRFIRLLLLTKRPENVLRMWPTTGEGHESGGPAGWIANYHRPNVHLYYSASDQESLEAGIGDLLACRDLVPVLGLSLEPLVAPIDLLRMKNYRSHHKIEWLFDRIDHVIIGGESGHGSRPCNIDWIRSIVQQCAAAGVPCFVKQLGSHIEIPNDSFSEWPQDGEGLIYSTEEWEPVQGHPVSVRTRDKKGGDPAEWPEDLRVRQFPKVETTTC